MIVAVSKTSYSIICVLLGTYIANLALVIIVFTLVNTGHALTLNYRTDNSS